MSKKTKIFLAVLTLISIGISLAIVFDFNPLILFSKKQEKRNLVADSLETSEKISPVPSPEFEIKSILANLPQDIKFKLPVDEKYFEKTFSEGKEVFLVFYLEPGAEIRPIFPGEVLTSVLRSERDYPVGKDPESIIVWVKSENGLRAEYFFLGEDLVKEGDMITEDTILGRVGEGSLVSRKNGNFSLMVVNGNGEMIELSKDLFSKD